MPTPSAILDGLTAVSNDWRGVAVGWHVLLGLLIIGLVSGWRPNARGLFYGLLGVFYLNVTIDIVLLAGALALTVSWMRLNLRLALKLRV